jgi:DNA-binding NtrC family response regulator
MSPICEKVKIMIVDDEPVVRQAFTRILSCEQCTVESAANGRDALRSLQRQRCDLVLLDLRMPGIDGLTVLREIKRNWPEVEVVVITGHAALETAKESVALGAFDYLAKPVGPDEVIRITNSALLHKAWALRVDRQAA